MSEIAIIVLVAIVLVLGIIILPRLMLVRAIRYVIQTFRQHDALDSRNAKAIEELRLAASSMPDRIFRMRDYRPSALETLISANIVRMTEDGRLYLSEETLGASK